MQEGRGGGGGSALMSGPKCGGGGNSFQGHSAGLSSACLQPPPLPPAASPTPLLTTSCLPDYGCAMLRHMGLQLGGREGAGEAKAPSGGALPSKASP